MNALKLKKMIDGVMRPEGFLRKGSSWNHSSKEVSVSLLLRKSTHGNYFYLDVDASLVEEGARSAVNSLTMNALKFVLEEADRDFLARALEIESNFDVNSIDFEKVIRKWILEACRSYLSLDSLREIFRTGGLTGALIGWKMRETLERHVAGGEPDKLMQ